MATLSPAESFLSAWEAAGRPQVQMIKYPRSGRSTHSTLSHSEVLANVSQGQRFADDGRFSELEWEYVPELAEGISSTCKLMFDRG